MLKLKIWIKLNRMTKNGLHNVFDRLLNSLLPEVTHEQEEPDSAFEATQYFFEDITPETSIGKDLRSAFFVILLGLFSHFLF